MGNTPCGEMTTSYKTPLNAVNKDYNNFQMIEYTELFQYPSRYPYILSYLRSNSLQFQDMYFPVTEARTIVGVNLIRETQKDVVWKRITQIKFKQPIRYTDILFQRPSDQYRKPHAMYRLLAWISSIPKLVKKIFTFESMNKQGLVIVYLPLWGSHDEPIQIVIDDDIPMKNDHDYYFNLLPNCSITAILLEKTLAKIFGSYEKVRTHSIVELFQTIVGLPICTDQVGNKDPLEVLTKYYRPNYHLMSYNKKFENHKSEYFKFTLQTDAELSLSIWQLLQNPHSFEVAHPGQVVMELMRVDSESKVVRVGYSSKLYKDTTFLRTVSPFEQKGLFTGRDFLKVQRGHYLLHIYTKTDNVSLNANLVVYSSIPINMTYRKQNYELNAYKRRMAENVFMQGNKELQKCLYTERVYSKFIWDGFRGILAFKNQQLTRIKISILIKEEYRKKIKLQHSEQYEEVIFLKPGSKKMICFVKFIGTDVGNFYSMSVTPLKQDVGQPDKGSNTNRPPSYPSQTPINQSNYRTPTTIDLSSSPFKQREQTQMYEQSSMISEARQFNDMNTPKYR